MDGDKNRRVRSADETGLSGSMVYEYDVVAPWFSAQAANGEDVKIDEKWLLGRVEWLWLPALEESVKARIDSGAKTSSLSATEIESSSRKVSPGFALISIMSVTVPG
ncbi:RimK/LysX family protein [Oceanimonas sp. NS1]|nr:RimK/LysX family protein [Oceanimonas sp. NS1]